MILTVTALYTALFLLLLLALATMVVSKRMRGRVAMGDGNQAPLQQAIRAHGNAAEYVPIVLIGLAVLENMGTSPAVLHVYGAAFFIARVAHAWGMAQKITTNNARKLGIVVTWLVMLLMAVQLLWRVVLQATF